MINLQDLEYSEVITRGLRKPSSTGAMSAAELLGDSDVLYIQQSEGFSLLLGALALIRVTLLVTSVVASAGLF
jgi:hypothetical protein